MTTEISFKRDPEVTAFVEWLGRTAQSIEVTLSIPASRKVPGGVRVHVTGLESVTLEYRWKAVWRRRGAGYPSEDWKTTVTSLAALSDHLRSAVGGGDHAETLEVCKEILRWGGDRNSARGATPFLEAGLAAGAAWDLATYIREAHAALQLNQADLTQLHAIQKMNSMLTKVHALYSRDGLPIYDSRVAVAIAALVELWRRKHHTARRPRTPPTLLTFPSVDSVRTVTACFEDAARHGTVAARGGDDTRKWTSAKIRLGWILNAVLRAHPKLFAGSEFSAVGRGGPTLPERMHAFEAALFMIGYDVRCLEPNFTGVAVIKAKALAAAAAAGTSLHR